MKTYWLTRSPHFPTRLLVLVVASFLLLSLTRAAHAHPGVEIAPPDDPWGVQDLKNIIRRVAPTVVTVLSADEQGEVFSLGSGFVIREDGLIVTNYHVVKHAYTVTIKTKSGAVYAGQGFVGFNVERDVAVLKVRAHDLPTVELGNAHRAEVGDPVITIGHPHGLEHTVSTGIISQKRQFESNELLQHTASISSGNSGGPLLDAEGRVIGINTSTLIDGQNLNFAMPIHYVEEIMRQGTSVRYDFAAVAAWQMEQDVSALMELLDLYEDPYGRFIMAYPKAWITDHDGYWSEDRTVYHEFIMFAPVGAVRREVLGYLSEGIRIRVQQPTEDRVFTAATLDEYGPIFVEGVLNANPGFALTSSDAMRVAHREARVYGFIGQNQNIPEPEKTTFIVLADQHQRIIIEMVFPVSKLAAYEHLYPMLMSSFQTGSLATASY